MLLSERKGTFYCISACHWPMDIMRLRLLNIGLFTIRHCCKSTSTVVLIVIVIQEVRNLTIITLGIPAEMWQG
jgi:hypothetical protein